MYAALSGLTNGLILAIALTAIVATALRLTPRRTLNAATRYVIWWATLAAAIVIPIAATVPMPRLPHRQPGTASPAPLLPPQAIAPIATPPRPAVIPISIGDPKPLPQWPLLIWPATALLLLTRLATSLVRLNRLKSRARPLPLPQIETWLTACQGRRPGIRLALSPEIATPIATGPAQPTILIPTGLFENLTPEDLDRIGLHETAHLVRRDDYALIAQRLLEALFIPYPLVFWIARRIDLEREIACDDLVIAALGRPRSYAACLTRIVENCEGLGSPWPAATAAEDASQLTRRVEALLDKTRRAGAHLMKARLAASTAVLASLVLLTGRAPTLIAFVTTQTARLIPIRRAAILPIPAQSQPPQPATPGETGDDISGEVKEQNTGHPIPSAELRFHKQGLRELAADLETDRQGRFSASGLPPGQYSVEVLKSNYDGATFQLAIPAAPLTVKLTRYGAIDGRAANASGQPLAGTVRIAGGRAIGGVQIAILTKDPATGRLARFRETQIEEDGHYRAFNLPPGHYAVGLWYSAQNEGSGMQLYPDTANPRFFEIKAGEEYDHIDFTVTPRPSASISGAIRIPAGLVRKNFQLALGLPGQPGLPIAQLWSEDDGTFRFEKIPPGTYDLFVAGPVSGYGAGGVLDKGDSYYARARVESAGQNIENLSIAVTPAKSLRVTLRAQGNGPLPKGCPETVDVNVTPLEPWYIMYFPGSPVAFGKEQTVPNLAPGLFQIGAGDLGKSCFQTNSPVVDLSRDLAEPVAIEIAAAGSIRGILHAAAAGAAVTLTGRSDRRTAYTDAAGRFAFESLPPGDYKIGSKEIQVKGGETTEIQLTPQEVNP